ncbi:3833_t:CDS:2 [Diversispora eburnea]|uniref:3833_t:CDS:1 n=1 Tax=Diversispora eburnea TaxID=1213867 RepID=A0A9N8YNY1_9GLOM|nr:3833_t:CDS:2 [Diversispora eburnea]
MSPTQAQIQQHSSTHMMKTTKSGRPFVKDIHDLYSTLVVSLPMETHRNLFRSYSNSFTTEEAIANLGSLRFTQSHRTPDPKDPSRIITTTTTTTFSMTKEMAKSVCQTFMDARLFENLSDSGSRSFKDKCVYGLTQKGLYVLERFVTRNGISAPHLAKLFASQTIPIRLYFIERRPENDAIVIDRQNIESVFRRFAGTKPNYITNKDIDGVTNLDGQHNEEIDRNLGIELKDRQINHKTYQYTFSGMAVINWLCDFSTLITKEEAMEIATEFIQYGFVEQISDKSNDAKKRSEKADISSFKCSKSIYYRIMTHGRQVASWDFHDVSENNNELREISQTSNVSDKDGSNHFTTKESNAKKLQQILEDKYLRTLFMDFLKANFCEENLLFLMDVKTFKIRYNTNISKDGKPLNIQEQEELVNDAFRIYNTYLAPASSNELNIDHGLRQKMIQYMTSIVSTGPPANTITGHLYDSIEDTIFRLLASDSVPKFVKTKEYLASAQVRKSDGEYSNTQLHKYSSSASTNGTNGSHKNSVVDI